MSTNIDTPIPSFSVLPTTRAGCLHMEGFKTSNALISYRKLVCYSLRFLHRTTLPGYKNALKKVVLPTPICHCCESFDDRLHVCLSCVFVGCWSKGMKEHFQTKAHPLAMDFLNRTVFCFNCNDYVYDHDYEEILRVECIRLQDLLSSIKDPLQKRALFSSWQPKPDEVTLIKSKATVHRLRGLQNLGSTCFMNVILQSFIHNPPLRAYFLSDKHSEDTCSLNDCSRCMACQLDRIFNEFYNGEKSPVAPNGFLWAMWMSCKELVGYAQQDCHEFFIGVLNTIHSNLDQFTNETSPSITDPHSCSCIIHRVFSGVFRSTVTCLNCQNESFSNDPFLDVSLDVRPVFSPMLQAAALPDLQHVNGASTNSVDTNIKQSSQVNERKSSSGSSSPTKLPPGETHSLYECLDMFTHRETLRSYEYKCSKCQNIPLKSGQISLGAVKQLSFMKFPLVLSLQLKRYEHNFASFNGSTNEVNGSKITMNVRFPMELDLTPYSCDNIVLKNSTDSRCTVTSDPSYIYTLFAVIVHSGTLTSGHYYCYIRQSGIAGQWFKFDDNAITAAEWNEVARSEAYMCFYVKKKFEYFNS